MSEQRHYYYQIKDAVLAQTLGLGNFRIVELVKETDPDPYECRNLYRYLDTRDGVYRTVRLEPWEIDVAPDDVPVQAIDAVNHPQHYQFFPGMEAIEVIATVMTQEQFHGYCLGNALKYRLRAGAKDALEQDIAKAKKYTELYEKYKEFCCDATPATK